MVDTLWAFGEHRWSEQSKNTLEALSRSLEIVSRQVVDRDSTVLNSMALDLVGGQSLTLESLE